MKRIYTLLIMLFMFIGINNAKALKCVYHVESGSNGAFDFIAEKGGNVGKIYTNYDIEDVSYMDTVNTRRIYNNKWYMFFTKTNWQAMYEYVNKYTFASCPSTLYYSRPDYNAEKTIVEFSFDKKENYKTAMLDTGQSTPSNNDNNNPASISSCEFFVTVSLKTGVESYERVTFNGTIKYNETTNKLTDICIEVAGTNCTNGDKNYVATRLFGPSHPESIFYFDNIISNASKFKGGCPDPKIYYEIDDTNYGERKYDFNFNVDGKGSEVTKYEHGVASDADNYDITKDPDRTGENSKLPSDKDGSDIEQTCEGLIGPNTLEFLRILRNIVMIAGPILAVILGTYDMIQAMASGEDDAKKKGLKRLKGRLIAAVLLLLAPYIIFLLVQISPAVGKDCINQVSYIVSDAINILK